MRIILPVVFYVVAYVAKIAIGDIATTMPGNSMKYIFGQKAITTRNRISGVPIDDEMTQKTMKRSKQSLLINRIDGLLQSRRDNGKLARVRRERVRKRTKRAKNMEDKITRLDFENDDDNDNRDDVTSNTKGLRGLPVWQIPEPTVPTVNMDLTTNPTIIQIGTINRSSLTFATLPSHLAYLDSNGILESDDAIFTTRANLPGILDELPETFIGSGLVIDNSQRTYQPKAVALSKIPVYILSYPAKYDINASDKNFIFSKIPSTKLARPQRFRWQFDGYQKATPKSHDIKEQLRNNRLIRRRFLLVPISKDLYVLKNVGDRIPRLRTDKDNAMSAILSFKAHMHHDAKNAGRVYLRRDPHNYRLFEHNANDLHSASDPSFDIVEENANPMENSMPLSHINFMYPDRMNISGANADSYIDLDDGVGSYDSTPSSLDMPGYEMPLHSVGNADNRQQNILPAIKVDKTDPFRLDGGNYEQPLVYFDLGAESTTMGFRNLFDTPDNHIGTSSVTYRNVAMYLNDSEVYDMSQNIKGDTKLSMMYENQDVGKQDVTDYILTQYRLASDAVTVKDYTAFSDTTYTFADTVDNVLSNQDIDMAYQKSKDADNGGSVISNGFYNEKPTDTNNLIYNDKFIDETLRSDHTSKVDSFLSTVDYTTSVTLFSNIDELSLKRQESTVENSRNLLMAIKPLSSELEKLLNAVKLVNESISSVQSRLCDKKNVARPTRIERDSEGRKAVKRVLSIEDLGRRFRGKKRIKTKSTSSSKAKSAVARTVDDIELRKRTNDYFLLLNRLTTPLRKRASLANNAEIQSGNRNFLEEQRLNEGRSFKSDDIERRRSSQLRLNRSLKSLTGNYDLRTESTKMTRSTKPIIRFSHLIRNDVSSKNNFLNNRVQNSQRYNNKSIVLSANTTFLDMLANKDNRTYFSSYNNKRDLEQRDTPKAMSNETSVTDREKKFPNALPPIDPQFYTEATAYLDILRLLNGTEEPYVERSPTGVDWTLDNVTKLLSTLISTTPEFSATTTTFMPYFVEKPTTAISSTTLLEKEELPGTTEVLYEHETGTPYFEYYKYDEDYDERNYTEMYEDYDEYEGNITSWYDYTEETTTEMEKVSSTIITGLAPEFTFEKTTTSVEITKTKMDYDMETAMSVETTMRYTTAEYPFIITTTGILITTATVPTITTESFEIIPATQLAPTLNVSIVTTPSTPPLFYTTQLPTPTAITTTEIITDEIVTEATESTVAIPKTESLTTASMVVLTPILEGITDITLRITIPASTETPLGETPSLIAATTLTEEEITESTSMARITQTHFNETSTFLYEFSTEPIPVTTEAEWMIQITTAIGPILTPLITTKRSRTTTPIEKTVSAVESTITVTDIIPIGIITRSTVTSGENVTLRRPTTSNVTYITTLETEIEKVAPLTTQILTTRVPTNITTRLVKETSLAEDTETTLVESTSAEITSKEPKTTTETKTSSTTSMERISTNVTIVSTTQFSITEVTVSTIETLTTPTTISEITIGRLTAATITSTPTKSMKMILSTTTEAVATTVGYAIAEGETPVTQIEKTIIAEETTTTETATTIETLITTEILTITETSTTTESTMATETPITVQASVTTLTPTSTEKRTVTEISVTTETPTTTEIPTPTGTLTATETRTTSEIPGITETLTAIESIKTTENQTITEISTTAETLKITSTSTTTETPASTVTPTSIETIQTRNITEILETTESPTTETPTFTETSTTTKITTTSEMSTINETSTTTETSTAIESTKTTENITTTEISTIVETMKVTEASTTIETLVTAATPTSTETQTTTEVPITTGSLTPTKTPIISMINVTTLSTTESTMSLTETMFSTKEFLSTPTVTTTTTTRTTPFLTDIMLNETISATIFTTQSTGETEGTTSSVVSTTISLINDSLITPSIPPITKTTASINASSTINETIFTTLFTTETIVNATTSSITPVTTSVETVPITLTAIELPVTVTSIETTIPTASETTLLSLLTNATLTEMRCTATSITPSKETETAAHITSVTATTPGTFRITTPVPLITSITPSEIISNTTISTFSTEEFVTTSSTLEEVTTETTETSLITTIAVSLLTTERPEHEKILEVVVTVTLTPFTESFLSTLITPEVFATIPEVTSALSNITLKTEDFTTMSTTEMSRTTESSTNEVTVYLATSTSIATTKETPEAETEYYAETEPRYEEKYEEDEKECDTEIPTDSWYDYEEYEITTKKGTTTLSTVKHTRFVEEKITSLSFDKGATTSPYRIKTSEFTTSSAVSDTPSIQSDVISTATTSRTPYAYTDVESSSTSTSETAAFSTTAVETASTISTASEEEESATTGSTFGSTEEYTLPSTTIFEITTKPLPLEYPTVLTTSMRDVESTLESSTQAWRDVTLPKFITKPEEIPDRETELEKIPSFEKIDTTSERGLTEETEVSMEKLTSFFVSSVLPTLSEEPIRVYVTTSTAFSDLEGIEATTITDYEATTQPMRTLLITEERTAYDFTTTYDTDVTEITSEEIIPYTTSFAVSKIEIERKRLLQRLDELKRLEKELAEREENLRKKQRQWDEEKERRKKTMLHEKEKIENITAAIGTSAVYITTTVTDLTSATHVLTDIISTENISASAVTEIGVTFPILDTMFTVTSSPSLGTITLASTETTSFYATEKSTYVKYTTERVEEIATYSTTIETISTTYATGDTEETYTTSYEISPTSPTLITFTSPITSAIDEFTTLPTTTTFSMYDLIDLTSMAIPIYTTEERYVASYADRYEESTFSLPTLTSASSITSALDKFTTLSVTASSDTFDEIGATFVTTPTSYITEETFTATYEDVYSESSSISPTLAFASIAISPTSSTLAISTVVKIEYDEDIEGLKQELYKKERELDEREEILLKREKELEKDIAEFEKYMEKIEREQTETTIALSEEPTMPTNLSTPVPPTEKTTTKAQVTKQVRKTTEKKENRTTTEMVTSRDKITKMKDIEEKERTRYVPEETVTREEEEIVTKRICLNVLENTTVPLDKRGKDVVVKKLCLPYFPERNREKKLVGRLSRKLLTSRGTGEIRDPKSDLVSDFRYGRRPKATILKISNLQLSRHEWLNNETTKSLRHFKGFTRVYGRTMQISKTIATIINAQESIANYFPDRDTSHEGHTLRQRENLFQPVTVPMLNAKKCRKRRVSFDRNQVPERVNNLFNNDKMSDEKKYISPTQKNTRLMEGTTDSMSQKAITINHSTAKEKKLKGNGNASYTVNVLRLAYNKNDETHEVISVKPDEDELTAFISGSSDKREYDDGKDEYNYVNGKTDTNAKSYELEEGDDLKEKDNDSFEGIEDEEGDDYAENNVHCEKQETSTRGRILGDRREQRTMIEPKTGLLDQIWPTEQSTMYHLGGTRFWELEFQVTESSVKFSTTTSSSKIIDLPAIRTTCLDVVLKTARTDAKMKRNVHRHKRGTYFITARMKRDVYNYRTSKYNTLIERPDTILKNVTRKNILHNGTKIKWPSTAVAQSATVEQLIDNSQKLRESHRCRNNVRGKRITKFYDFPYDSNEDSVMTKGRKLCGINENKSKHQTPKHKDTRNIKDKNKNKRLTNPEKLRTVNSYSLKTCTNRCTVHKKNSDKHDKKMITKTNTNVYSQTKSSNDKNKVTYHDVSVDHKNKSMSQSIPYKGKVHRCTDCICDIEHVVDNIKSILDRISYPFDEIKALNCSEYKEIEDKIVISIDSDMEEVKAFPQTHYNTESLKGQKYIKLEELEDDPKNYLELENDRDIVSLPGLNLNMPCNQEGNDITWLSSISRPSYSWRRTDGITLFGFVAENGDLELRNVNAKDTGNYTCIMMYTNPDNEEPMETIYEVHLQVVTLPKYILHGENHYRVRSCDDRDLDMLVTYFPLKLNNVICEANICNAYILTPSCSRNQITINILIVPSRTTKLLTVDHKHCNVFCLKAIQDKLSMILSKNLQIFFGKTIIFRLPHVEQRLVPIPEKSSFARFKRGRTGANTSGRRFGSVGLFSSCPAGYGLRGSQCVPCDVDTYSEDGISHCKICPPGTYQPNHGARVCRTCTNPLTKGCYNMLWNSFSAVIVTLASVSVMLSFFLLILWIICCAKKKFCVKQITSIISQEDAFEQEKHVEEQPLIKDTSENEDQQGDSEYTLKRKKGKFYVNKKRRKQNEKKKYGKTQIHKDEWGSHHMKDAPIICLESYRSHEDYNNYYPKQLYRKGPRLPECDFDT